MEPTRQQRWCLPLTEDLSQPCMEISWRYSPKPGRKHPHHICQLNKQSIWNPATLCHMGGLQLREVELNGVVLNGVFSCFEFSGAEFTQLGGLRSRAHEARSWIWTYRSHAIWMDQWVGNNLSWTICHRIMGLWWRVNGRRISWTSVKLTFRELTKL